MYCSFLCHVFKCSYILIKTFLLPRAKWYSHTNNRSESLFPIFNREFLIFYIHVVLLVFGRYVVCTDIGLLLLLIIVFYFSSPLSYYIKEK